MALSNTGAAAGGTYISLKKGYWGKRVEEGTEGAVPRERGGTGDNAKDTIYELRYDTLSGIIKNAYIEEGKFGNNLNIVIEDEGESFIAQIKADGVLAGSIIKTLPNIDVDSEVFLKAYTNKKDHGSLWIEQNGEGVKWAFTKDEPNGLPQPVEKTVKGKKVWDWDEQENFLYDTLVKWCSQFEGKKEAATADDLVF